MGLRLSASYTHKKPCPAGANIHVAETHNAKGKQVKHVIYYYMTASAKEPTGARGQEKLGKRDGQF